jgi:NAD(P)-dependent dehydrogenase (short-subunit alcohol dehydrogenase family)
MTVAGTNVMTWTFMTLLLKSVEPRLIFVAGLSNINQAAVKYFPTPPQPAG